MAAARFDFALFGDKALAAQLAALPDKLERKILAAGIRKATRQILLPAIRASAPVREVTPVARRGKKGRFLKITKRQIRTAQRIAQRFARLKNSFAVRQLRRRKGRVGSAVYTGTRAQLGITGRGYYPAHQEFGFKTRNTRRL